MSSLYISIEGRPFNPYSIGNNFSCNCSCSCNTLICSIVKLSLILNPPDDVRVRRDICAGKPNALPISVASVRIYVPLPQVISISNKHMPCLK